LPGYSAKRKLEGTEALPSEYCFSVSLTYDTQHDKEFPGPVAKAYRYGSSVARNLKAFALDFQKKRGLNRDQLRAQLGSAVLRSVVGLKEAYLNLATDESGKQSKTLAPNQFFEILSTQLENLSTEEVATLKPPVDSNKKVRILCN